MPSQQIPAARRLGPESSTALARAWRWLASPLTHPDEQQQSIARRLHAILHALQGESGNLGALRLARACAGLYTVFAALVATETALVLLDPAAPPITERGTA